MTRSRLLSICLTLFLLFAQQGALVHALSHPLFAQRKQSELQLPSQAEQCDLCLAYSALGNGIPAVAPILALTQAPSAYRPPAAPSADSALLCAYLSRAPPVPLA